APAALAVAPRPPAEAALVPAERDQRAVRRPRERALALAPRRVAVLGLFLQQRSPVRPAIARDPEVQPAAGVGEERQRRAPWHEPGLPDRDVGAAGKHHPRPRGGDPGADDATAVP